MGRPEITAFPEAEVQLGEDVGLNYAVVEWAAFANSGYIFRARIHDPYLNFLDRMAKTQLLPKARKEPLEVVFKLKWAKGKETRQMKAWVADVTASGDLLHNITEIVAIDPPSWALNAGKSKGIVYKGKVSSVISKVCDDVKKESGQGKAPNLVKVSETTDDENNKWWMMKQDPKTFIQMLLDWSSSVTPKKTNWVVNCRNYDVQIIEQADIEEAKFGVYNINLGSRSGAGDMMNIKVQSDTLTTFWQARLLTQGMSTISGKYLDKITAEPKVTVKDENTSNKIDAKSTPEESFKKPTEDWSTSIMAVPEHNAGDVGVPYEDYIDGRPRQMFIGQLSTVHRVRIRVHGDAEIDDPFGLEGTPVNLIWQNEEDKPYWLGGRWIVYGFHHIMTRKRWTTDVYLRRFEYDSSAQKR